VRPARSRAAMAKRRRNTNDRHQNVCDCDVFFVFFVLRAFICFVIFVVERVL
jgi:hypothetical protein